MRGRTKKNNKRGLYAIKRIQHSQQRTRSNYIALILSIPPHTPSSTFASSSASSSASALIGVTCFHSFFHPLSALTPTPTDKGTISTIAQTDRDITNQNRYDLVTVECVIRHEPISLHLAESDPSLELNNLF